jgi:hypothetical protein
MKVKLELVIDEDEYSVHEVIENIIDRAKEITTVDSVKAGT